MLTLHSSSNLHSRSRLSSIKIYGKWVETNNQTSMHTCMLNAVSQVWGSLRFAPRIQATAFFSGFSAAFYTDEKKFWIFNLNFKRFLLMFRLNVSVIIRVKMFCSQLLMN